MATLERCPRCGNMTSGHREGDTEYCTSCGGVLAPARTVSRECISCFGYGYFDQETDQPTIYRRGRKCLDCLGTGFLPEVVRVEIERRYAALAAAQEERDRLRAENGELRAALEAFPGRSCSELEWNLWVEQKNAALRPGRAVLAGKPTPGPGTDNAG